MQPVIVFDVNETLLDLEPIRMWFLDRFDGRVDASQWFGELLRLSFVSAATDQYSPFTSLAAVALETSASVVRIATSDEDVETLGRLMRSLTPHVDALPGIERLVEAGFRVTALTNSPQDTANAQLRHAGLDHLIDPIMSVEMVRRFKPHGSVYRAAALRLGVSTTDMAMIAAHDWDIAGALAAGCQGVFIDRGGRTYSPAFSPPTMTANDISHAAEQLVQRLG